MFAVNVTTDATSLVGNMGDYPPEGDIVSVEGSGTVISVLGPLGQPRDTLLKLAPDSFAGMITRLATGACGFSELELKSSINGVTIGTWWAAVSQ